MLFRSVQEASPHQEEVHKVPAPTEERTVPAQEREDRTAKAREVRSVVLAAAGQGEVRTILCSEEERVVRTVPRSEEG